MRFLALALALAVTATGTLVGCHYPFLLAADKLSKPEAPPLPAHQTQRYAWEESGPKDFPPTREAAIAGILAAQAAQAAKEKAAAEEASRAKFQARVEAAAEARQDGLCKTTDDDRTCFHAYLVNEDVLEACSLLDDVRRYQAIVAHEWSEAKKYGVVDRDVIYSAKSMAQGKEASLAEVAERIEQARGKPFRPKKDCPTS